MQRKNRSGFSISELVALSLLHERDRSGFELAKSVSTLTSGGRTHIGVVYSVLKDLMTDGYVAKRIGERSQNYYSLTPEGQGRLITIAVHWEDAQKAIGELVAHASESLAPQSLALASNRHG